MAAGRLCTLLVATLACLLATKEAWTHPTSRIIGGTDAQTAAFPHAASLRLDNAHYCGATIIGLKHILTAAHCVVDENSGRAIAINRLSVRVGSINQFAGGKIHVIEKVTPHPEYEGYVNDIAVLTLTLAVTPSDRVKHIELAQTQADRPAANTNVVVAGWGRHSLTQADTSYILQEKTFKVATDEVCHDANENINESNICLSHDLRQGNCKGDAGNGAVYNNKLIGVCSFVVGACGSIYPDVFANVEHYAPWIQAAMT